MVKRMSVINAKQMKAEYVKNKDGKFEFHLIVPANEGKVKDMPESGSRLSNVVATTGPRLPFPLVINGQQVVVDVGFTASVRIPGRKKLKNGSVVDADGTVLIPPTS